MGLGFGSLGCWTFFFATNSASMGLVQAVDGFVGESLLQSPIARALAPDVTRVGACVIPHGHGHGPWGPWPSRWVGAWAFALGASLVLGFL